MPKSACIYVRVSSEKQALKASIPEQLEACRVLARKEGYRVVAEYVDDKEYRSEKGRMVQPSGTRIDRPGLVQMLADAGKKWQVCIAWAQDRLGRGSAATVYVRDGIESARCKVVLVNGDWDADTVEIFGAISGYELRKIQQRMMLGKLGRFKDGLHIGEAPFGYGIIRGVDGKSTGYSVIPAEAAQLHKMAKLYLAGVSLADIREQMGINPRTGRGWLTSTVFYILHNPFYFGRIVYGKRRPAGETWYGKGKQPLIWDAATQAAIERENKRRSSLGPRGPRRKKYGHIFAGIVRCAICKRPMGSGVTHTITDRTYLFYRCLPNSRRRQGLDWMEHASNHISETKLLTDFKAAMLALTPQRLAELAAEAQKGTDRKRESDAALHALQEQRAELSGSLLGLSGVAASVIEAEIVRLDREIESLAGEIMEPARQVDVDALVRVVEQLQANLSNGQDRNELRALVRQLGMPIYAKDGRLVAE